MEKEMYAVDISSDAGAIIYGGGNNSAEVYYFREDSPLCSMPDFPESVVYVKFIDNLKWIVVALDGTIIQASHGDEVNMVSIEEDVSVADYDEKLVVGTESGRVYLYGSDLEHINTFGGHSGEVIAVKYIEGRIYSLSLNNLLVHDEYGRCLCTLKAHDATSFCHIGGDVVCLGRNARAQVFKGTHKLFEYPSEHSIDDLVKVGSNIVIGGSFDYLVLVDTTFRYATYKLEIGVCVLKLKPIDENTVAFSTTCNRVGIVDIRDVTSLLIFQCNVGTIFDFAYSSGHIVVGGMLGVALLNDNGEIIYCFENETFE